MDTSELAKNYKILQAKLKSFQRQVHHQNQILTQHDSFRERIERTLQHNTLKETEKLEKIGKILQSPINRGELDFNFEANQEALIIPAKCNNCLKYIPLLATIFSLTKQSMTSETPLKHSLLNNIQTFLDMTLRCDVTLPKHSNILIEQLQKLTKISQMYSSGVIRILSTQEIRSCLKSKCEPYTILADSAAKLDSLDQKCVTVIRNPRDDLLKSEFYSGFRTFCSEFYRTLTEIEGSCAKSEYKNLKQDISNLSLVV